MATIIELIDKAAVVSEIEKRYNECLKRAKITDSDYWNANADAYRNVLAILDGTLEVKEVDLRNELKEDWLFADKTEVDCLECMCLTEDMFVSLAKKYFKLGLKAKEK